MTIDMLARNREIMAMLGHHPGDVSVVYRRRGRPAKWARATRDTVDARWGR